MAVRSGGGALYARFLRNSWMPGMAVYYYSPEFVSTYNNYVNVRNIKMNMFLAEHWTTEENGL